MGRRDRKQNARKGKRQKGEGKMTGRGKAKKGKKKNIFKEVHLKKNMSTLDKQIYFKCICIRLYMF